MTTLIVPGLGNSGPQHWQTWLEQRLPHTGRVVQPDWGLPDLDAWSQRIAEAVDACDEPPILVAHSFGVLATAHAAARTQKKIAAAMLVAPADPEVFGYADILPRQPLPFPATLVASHSDPWMTFDAASLWAQHWGARLIDAGHVGHINVDSGHGPWLLGLAIYRGLKRELRAAPAVTFTREASLR